MAQLTPYGKKIKKKLIDIDCRQEWLIEQVRNRTGLYFDDSYMHKIMTGKLASPKIVAAINDVLNISQ